MELFKKKKPLIVTIHGFGRNLHHEFDPLTKYLNDDGYEVIQFDMYDINDENDADAREWVKRCEIQVSKALKKNSDLIIIGFSMGGVIASYLASVFKLHSLILCAPAFEYMDLSKVTNLFKKSETKGPSLNQYQAFTKVVSLYKESIAHVDCPILILHGRNDEVIAYTSSINAYKKIHHDKKRMLFIEEGKHRMLYDGKLEKTAFAIIETMIEDKLI